ncbi:hypothetical protein GF402_03360 [Candidatus Fermentibacteria bacterium]|nr:hypothetical protein [Candidatus Fermentibacteria bacterium]
MRVGTVLVMVLALSVGAGAIGLADTTFEMDVGQYRFVSFRVQPQQTERTSIEGSLQLDPDTIEIELILMHLDDFVRWRNNQPDVDTLFHVRTGSGEVDIPVDGFGDFVLVVSNRGNFHAATATSDLDLSFEGTGTEYNPLDMALKLALLLMGLAVVVILVVGIVRLLSRSKARES